MQLPPLTARFDDIQQRIHDPAQFIFTRTASGMAVAPRRLQPRLKLGPLRAGQIARTFTSKLCPATLLAYNFSGSFASF